MDGLIVTINDNFIKLLISRGLLIKSLKIRFLKRNSSKRGNRYVSYKTLDLYNKAVSNVLSSNPLLFSGEFPIIDTIEIENKNLSFKNEFKFYDMSGSRFVTKKLEFETNRKDFYESELNRYELIINNLIDRYIENVNDAMDIRLNSYVDPNYVDPEYLSPNSEANDPETLNVIETLKK